MLENWLCFKNNSTLRRMPLYKKIFNTNYTLIVWHLTEQEDFFLPHMPKFSSSPEKLDEIHVPQRRNEWLASRYIAWNTAKEVEGFCDGVWSDEHNKPHFKNSSLQLSISHAKPYVAVLVHKTMPCGIDIEEKKEKLIKLAPKFLTADELEQTNGNLDALALAWGAKEAIYKQHGRKQLIFKENIFLHGLDSIFSSGDIKCNLHLTDEDASITLHYEFFENHIFVYTI